MESDDVLQIKWHLPEIARGKYTTQAHDCCHQQIDRVVVQ